tara:strand:+ start:135 stop:317 length:183 start_codon:yes stop_codon:yes gene_type:complete
MEDDEDIIKKSLEKEDDYDEYSVEELLNQIKNLKKKLKYLENLLKNKKSTQNQADKLFKK